MRARRGAPAALLVALVASMLSLISIAPSATAGSQIAVSAPQAPQVANAFAAAKKKPKYVPPVGAVFNDPLIPGARGNVLDQVVLAARNTPKGEYIRLVVWNYDAPWLNDELIAAKKRGAIVQVITAGSVDSRSFKGLKAYLDRNPSDKNFAKKCKGACRSNSKIMHAKFFMFSKVGKTRNVSMFGSTNLTGAARNRQWNDQVTTTNAELYEYFVNVFKEYREDRPQVKPGQNFKSDKYQVVLFPVFEENPVADALSKVKCNGATGGTGNANGRTKIRIAVAGWFNGFGEDIAKKVRLLWDRGCDIRIVTTLLGRGVNRTLRNPAGRGPVPIHPLYQDRDADGEAERYLHMKSVSISGVYGDKTDASVVFTGSPNWSARAARSDEIWVKLFDVPKIAKAYADHIDRLMTIQLDQGDDVESTDARTALLERLRAHIREERAIQAARGEVGPVVSSWFELD